MSKRIAISDLNASTVDILNVIRQNASYEYQSAVPEVSDLKDIPAVGEVIYGTPSLANQFLNALVNRIALVRAKAVTFNNPYGPLKKGFIEYGETIEEIFVNIAKVVLYRPDKADEMEFRRTLPDVRSAFHTINWRVMYPVTIQDIDLRQAFLNADGVSELIAKIVDSVYRAGEYDEFLLFKYLLIKGVTHGKIGSLKQASDSVGDVAVTLRGLSNILLFPKTIYNEQGVLNDTPRDRQYIFMDSLYNAKFDVEVLAAAFHMEKATFLGHLTLVDDWTTFDNGRWAQIRDTCDGLEEVTEEELTAMESVRAIVVDSEWFQVYDNMSKFTEKYVASGLYWQYFYHTWKTISTSPFANAVVIATDVVELSSITYTITSKAETEDGAVVLALAVDTSAVAMNDAQYYSFVQTEALTKAGIGVQPYGELLIPSDQSATAIALIVTNTHTGKTYKASSTLTSAAVVGDTVTLAVVS